MPPGIPNNLHPYPYGTIWMEGRHASSYSSPPKPSNNAVYNPTLHFGQIDTLGVHVTLLRPRRRRVRLAPNLVSNSVRLLARVRPLRSLGSSS